MNVTANMMLFSGNANKQLAAQIAEHLERPLGQVDISRYYNGEVRLELKASARGTDAFIIQSTPLPVNENLMELMALADVLRRESVKRITAVIPYLGYARQDKSIQSAKIPIMAKVVADMVQAVGIDRVLTVDLYTDQIQGFFDIPVDNIYTTSVFVSDLQVRAAHPLAVVAPDIGGVTRARAVAHSLNASEFVIIDKHRNRLRPSQDMSIIGTVEGKHCIIIDDAVEGANTLCFAAQVIKEKAQHLLQLIVRILSCQSRPLSIYRLLRLMN